MAQTEFKCDRRSLRSQHALLDAFVSQLAEGEDLSRITVASLADRAGLTRRTFYTHYRDIPDFIDQVETALLDEIRRRIQLISASTLSQLYDAIDDLAPAPGSVELLTYLRDNSGLIGSLMGPGGDPAFSKKLTDLARDAVAERMRTGIFPGVLGSFFDYYLSSVVAAEVGVVQRWFERGLTESPETMARIMTVIAFIRPGDLYGKPIDINVPEYGMKLFNLQFNDEPVNEASTEGETHE